jgi:hypothetical protein
MYGCQVAFDDSPVDADEANPKEATATVMLDGDDQVCRSI